MLTINDLWEEDPFRIFEKLRTKLHTQRIHIMYPFAHFGRGVSIHHTCEILKATSREVAVGDRVYMGPNVWLTVWPQHPTQSKPAIKLGDRCRVGRGTMISATNCIDIGEDVLFAPSVLIMDHAHEYADIGMPIHAQGLTQGGRIRVEKNYWLGSGAAILCNSGELTIGRNSVVGANAVVNRSCPPYSVLAGNPAKVIKRYDPKRGQWLKVTPEEPQTIFPAAV